MDQESNTAVGAPRCYALLMPKAEKDEQYTPRGEKIPVPTRGEFDANLDKLLKAPPPPPKYRKCRSGNRPAGGREQ